MPMGTGAVGLAGDRVYDVKHYGGVDQAVYAYAREDLEERAEQYLAQCRKGNPPRRRRTVLGASRRRTAGVRLAGRPADERAFWSRVRTAGIAA